MPDESRIPEPSGAPLERENGSLPWVVRLLFLIPILALIVFGIYLAFIQDGELLKQAMDFFLRFVNSPEQLAGEALNLFFGCVVLFVWAVGQALDALLPYLDRFISIATGADIRGTESSRLEPVKSSPNFLLFILVYAILSFVVVGSSFG